MKYIITFTVACLLNSISMAQDEWPRWRGADLSDHSPDQGLLKKWPQDGPEQVWLYKDAGIGVGATTPFFLGEDDAPNSKTLVAQSVKLTPVPVTNVSSTQITVIGNDTGATSSITVTNRVTLASLAAL